MDSNKKTCLKCNISVSVKNYPRHTKTCCGRPRCTIKPQRPCIICGTLVTLNNHSRHYKLCNLKQRAIDDESLPAKIHRLDDATTSSITIEPQPAITDSVQSPVVSTFNAEASTIDNLLKPNFEIIETEKAFKNRMKTYIITNTSGFKDPTMFMNYCRPMIVGKIQSHVQENNLKVNVLLITQYKKLANNQELIREMNFKTKNIVILPTDKTEEIIKDKEKKILAEMEEFQTKGSGWTLNKLLHIELRINRYVPLKGSSYVELPQVIKNKKAVVNIRNNDQKCFLWSLLAALNPCKTSDVNGLYRYKQYEHTLDHYLQDIKYPVSLQDVIVFEKKSGISINVYSYDEKFVVYPLYVTKKENERHVDLLYIKDETNSHYCWIKNLSRLVRSQITKYRKTTWICKRCLLHFGREDLLTKHKEYCMEHDAVKIMMPNEGDTITFKDFNRSMKVPFVAYADFECMLVPIDTCTPTKQRSYTNKYQHHEAMSYCLYLVHTDGKCNKPITYFGPDAAHHFVNTIQHVSAIIADLYSSENKIPMIPLTNEENDVANSETFCHICGRPLNGDKVFDHDHLTGKFRGMAHNICNIKYQKPAFLPVFVHNLSGYDTHLFIKMFGLNNETIKVIPNNKERYISYTVSVKNGVELRFLDSFKFMSSSLEELTKSLNRDQFIHTSQYFDNDKIDLVLKKGVYPYDFMDSIDKYNFTNLPDQAEFYNKLNRVHISNNDYEHATNVWKQFKINNMREYTLLYNTCDVLLLADVMENFRNVCMQTYKLDPAWFFTAPGLAWSAMLKTTKVNLDLLSDYDMILMLTKGIRGGLSQCCHRYAAANNKYMENYDPNVPASYLIYLDANNMYGYAMSQYMPYGDFKWIEHNVDVLTVPDDADTGYILEVDLEYPKELHDAHSDLPLAPERGAPPNTNEFKLLTTLNNKDKYVVHYRTLKLYLSLGIKLKKVHRVLSFLQKDWLKTYIDLNTNMRTQARTSFEKDFYKLMNNSVFGKTMENIRNRVDIRLATKDKQVDKWIAQPNFKSRTIFTEQLSAVHMSKTRLLFNKAIYVGMSILDVSKVLMYNFHYNVMKVRYGKNLKLLYTDTDSLTYSVQTDDLYNDIKEMLHYFDTSDYPDPNRYDIPQVNKKVIGKFKDELNGRVMYEHVGLRSKMYASRSEVDPNNKEKSEFIKKSKGVKKSVVEHEIQFEDYVECLRQNKELLHTMNTIRSYNHNLYSVELNKISLSPHDNKRYILKDGISTLPWGHYAVPQDQTQNMEVDSALEKK